MGAEWERESQQEKEEKKKGSIKNLKQPSRVMSCRGVGPGPVGPVRPGGKFAQHVVAAAACTSLIASSLQWERGELAALVLDAGGRDGGHQQ
jgi:hypothetical protein